MATLQEQIDTLNRQLASVQNSITQRAKRTSVNTINVEVSDAQVDLEQQLEAYELCIRELQDGLLAAKKELNTHTH